jgi:mannan endo-1,4-beta-mannosidase
MSVNNKICFFLLGILTLVTFAQCNSPITFDDPEENRGGIDEGLHDQHFDSEGFVTVRNGRFMIDNEYFYFAGTNAYYLPNFEKIDPDVVDRAFDAFEEAGITVIRMWAFYDGFDCGWSRFDPDEGVIQTDPGVYDEESLLALDRVIAKGKERGIRFILPLINYWSDLGGVCQYNTWAGASNPAQNLDFFLNNSNTQQWFREYISMLLNRENTVTEVAYKDEPAIFGWQIINEGRNSGQDPTVLRDWYQEMAQYIKSITSRQLVSTGEEGFDEGMPDEYSLGEYSNTYPLRANEGTSFLLNTAIPEIDFVTAHWYPMEVGFRTATLEQLIRAQRAWLSDHQKIAAELNKPLVIGEYGFAGHDGTPLQALYEDFWEYSEEIGLSGTLIWQFVADDEKCYEVGSNICWPGGRQDQVIYEKFVNHIQAMNSRN